MLAPPCLFLLCGTTFHVFSVKQRTIAGVVNPQWGVTFSFAVSLSKIFNLGLKNTNNIMMNPWTCQRDILYWKERVSPWPEFSPSLR